MKKYLSLFAAMLLLVCLVGCQSESSESAHDHTKNETTTTTTQNENGEALATGQFNGKTIAIHAHLKTTYQPFELYYFGYNIATVATSDGFVMVDVEGKQIGKNSYNMLYSFGADGRAKARLDQDGNWVWIDTTGVVVGKAEAPTVDNTTARYDSSETTGVKKDDEYLFGIKDVATGDLITQPIFEWISDLSSPMNYAVLAESEHPQVMISPRGEVMVTLPDEATDAYAMDTHIVCKYQDGSYRLLDMQGTVLNQTTFSSISSFSEGLAVVTVGNKMGLIATDGTMVIEPQIEIDAPVTKSSPLIWKEYIVCLQQEQLTFYKITTTHTPYTTELPEHFASVLEDKQTFTYDGKECVLSRLLSDYQDSIGRYTLVDMDADSQPELAVEFKSLNFILVLKKDGASYYGHLFGMRSMYQINRDGSFYWNTSAGNYGCARIRFKGNTYEETELWREERGEDGSHTYYVEGNEVSKEDFDSATVEEKEKVVWVEWTGKQGTTNQELNHDELAKIVAKNLGVPDELDFTYEISERFYWEAGGIWFRDVVIHVEDGGGARASVDPTNGDLLRGILNYEKPE